MSLKDSREVDLTFGLSELVRSSSDALNSIMPDWPDAVRAQSLNQEVQLATLLEVSQAVRPDAKTALVRGRSAITRQLCRTLTERGVDVTLQLMTDRGTDREMFGVEVVRDMQDFNRFDLVIAAHRSAVPPQDDRVIAIAAPRVIPEYMRCLAAHREQMAVQLANIVRSERHVVFVSRKVYFNQIRMSAALRRRGYRTSAIVLDPDSMGYFDGFFDLVLTTDLCSLLSWVKRAERALLHTQGWLFGYDLPVMIDAFLPSSSRHVVDMMDLNSLIFPTEQLDQTLPLMRRAFGEDVAAKQRKQVDCEQYIYEHADGVLFPGAPGHFDALGLRGLGREERYLPFLVYPLPEFFSKPTPKSEPAGAARRRAEDLRLVFSGGIPPTGEGHPHELFGDAQMVTTAELLLEQGFDLTIYNNPLLGPESTYTKLYPEHFALLEKHPRYRFRIGGMPWEMKDLLRGYDYGLIVYDYTGMIFGEEHFRQLIPSKLFMYLEAGLPVLVSARAEATCGLVEDLGVGKRITDDELRRLPEVIETFDHQRLKQNVVSARERLSMDVQIERLIELYRRI